MLRHVGHQTSIAGAVLTEDRHRLPDPGVPGQRRLDLAQFDAEASQFDLVVHPSEESEPAAPVVAHQIAGLVQTAGNTVGPGALDEPLRSEIGPVQVPACQATTADVQLARHAPGYRLQMLVQYQQLRLRDRPPDAHRLVCRTGLDARDGRPDRRLRRSVEVPELPSPRDQGLGQRARQLLAAAEHLQPPVSFPARVQEHLPRGRRRLHHGDPTLGERLLQQLAVRCLPVRRDLDARPHTQGQEQFEHSDVERQRRHGEQDVLRVKAGLVRHRLQEVDHARVPDLDPLGGSGRARGEDHVRQIVGREIHGRRERLLPPVVGRPVEQNELPIVFGKPGA